MQAFVVPAAAVGETPWLLVATAGLTALGVIFGAAIAPFGDLLTRKDKLKGYKRNIYRNFLDHGYWFSHGNLPKKERTQRAVSYVADWHRIRLIAEDPEVLRLTKDRREPDSFTDDLARELLEAFANELGSGGIK